VSLCQSITPVTQQWSKTPLLCQFRWRSGVTHLQADRAHFPDHRSRQTRINPDVISPDHQMIVFSGCPEASTSKKTFFVLTPMSCKRPGKPEIPPAQSRWSATVSLRCGCLSCLASRQDQWHRVATENLKGSVTGTDRKTQSFDPWIFNLRNNCTIMSESLMPNKFINIWLIYINNYLTSLLKYCCTSKTFFV